MKTRAFWLLALSSAACAEPVPLPPVTNTATYPTQSTPATSTKTIFELMGRLEQMQVELQQLTGKVEEQTYQLNELKKRQNMMYKDFDDRLQAIENKSADGETTPTDDSAAADDKAPAAQPSAPADAAAAETPAPAAAPAPVQPAAKTPPSPPPADEKQVYQHAYDALRSGHTSQSITEFEAFLAQYPSSSLGNNAQYWLGEAHRVNQDAEAARKAFNKVVSDYPGTAKVPDALLKLGYIELEQNNKAKARDYLTRVTTEFPGSAAAHLAAKKLAQIH